jgi:hypothetical protein
MHGLKWSKISCEYVSEVAKPMVWEERGSAIACQPYISGKQLHHVQRLIGKVDVVVTDSPLLLGCIYGRDLPGEFYQYLIKQFQEMNNLNFLLKRTCDYDPKGRMQTEEESDKVHIQLEGLLQKLNINYMTADSTIDCYIPIVNIISRNLALSN